MLLGVLCRLLGCQKRLTGEGLIADCPPAHTPSICGRIAGRFGIVLGRLARDILFRDRGHARSVKFVLY